MVLALLLSAAALAWAAVALSVHTTGSTALDPDGVTDADVARLGAALMAGIAALAAGLWWCHWTTVGRSATGGGWARGAFAVSAIHSMCVVPVIAFASWDWKVPAIAFTCAVLAVGVREAAGVTAPATGVVRLG
ncbi:hypothetical protein [Streptomyces sp. NBC_01176]|uniref:hypothetical protein n=1 Tax=Streptomyces sp. NBC_01176 TaxID=2903760 RepID=UPI003870B2C9|nr:hypothetical protein OG199_06815 [Streptomyces sp. NBC_01176]